VSLTSPKFALDTSLRLSNGTSTYTVSLPTLWTCLRNRAGSITALRTVTPQAPAQRTGLTVAVNGPRTVTPGSLAAYTIRVRNTRRGPRDRDISSVWNIVVHANVSTPTNRAITVRLPARFVRSLAELRRGQTKLVRVRIHIPAVLSSTSVHRDCLSVAASAPSTRPAKRQACAAIGPRLR
jgi:hypothetical protein